MNPVVECPFCEQRIDLYKHVGRWPAALYEVDETLKKQADMIRNLPESQLPALMEQSLAQCKHNMAENVRRIRGIRE